MLTSTLRLVWYALRGGQEDALDELHRHEERLAPLRALGADVDARLQDAAMLEASGVPSEDVALIARIWASGRLDVETFNQLAERGIDLSPVVRHARGDRPEPRTPAATPPERIVVDRSEDVTVQHVVRGPLGTRQVPLGEGWTLDETPVAQRTVRRVRERVLGVWPGGTVVLVADGEPMTDLEDVEIGPWR